MIMFARVRDTELFFDVEGAMLVRDDAELREKPVVVALHGGPGGDHAGFKPALSPLADKAQIIYLDNRGCGRSTRGGRETYTLDNNVEDLEALRRHLGLGRIVPLGVSYGGMVALSYAVRYPHNVSHVIVVVTAASHRFLDRAQQILAERGTPEQRAVAGRLFAGAFENDEQMREYFLVLGPLYSLTFDPERVRKRIRAGIPSYEACNEGFGGFLRSYDVTGRLAAITAPTLVIGARHDWICPPEFSEEIAGLIPGADLRIFENSGHHVMVDEHAEFIDVVRGFLIYKST
jgi:proline iminopeptidase